MKTYAGIGSRDISFIEHTKIICISNKLADLGYVCYSGNANGSDIAFQLGAKNNYILFLPWDNFNFNAFRPPLISYVMPFKNHYTVGTEKDGIESVNKFHPHPKSLSDGARKLMARNYYQINGYNGSPIVDFVLCCADKDNIGGVSGGTGQAVRIAQSMNIPVINLRYSNWEEKLDEILNPLF